MTDIILTQTTKRELIIELKNEILSGITDLLKESRESDLNAKEHWTSKETEEKLKISAVTRWKYTKVGILKAYKIGNRLRYRKDEVLQALIKIESKRK